MAVRMAQFLKLTSPFWSFFKGNWFIATKEKRAWSIVLVNAKRKR